MASLKSPVVVAIRNFPAFSVIKSVPSGSEVTAHGLDNPCAIILTSNCVLVLTPFILV